LVDFCERCVDQHWRGTGREKEKERAWKSRDQQSKRRRFLENAEELRRLLVADFSVALVTRGWLAPESGESQVEIEGRCCRQVKLGR
jgi:hypothetical protein